MLHYIIIYKPFNVLCQFTSPDGKACLADYVTVPKDVYPVGRLDYDSEGLLLLTNDATINHRLLHPLFKHEREYWVQVDGAITDAALQQLQTGLQISVDGKTHRTLPAKAWRLNDPVVPLRQPPIRFRQHIPAPWIALQLNEGKNRQVRKMTAATGFPTLRLIRYRMGSITIQGMQPGDQQQLTKQQVQQLFDKTGK